jgi:hypothetical protein
MMRAKAIDIERLKHIQEKFEQLPCKKRNPSPGGPVSIHKEINSEKLPDKVRGKIYYHYHHICASMGCPYAPYKVVRKMVNNYKKHTSFFPRFIKGSCEEIQIIYNSILSNYLPDKNFQTIEVNVDDLLKSEELKIYPSLSQAIAFLFSERLRGKRHIGKMNNIISGNLYNSCKLTSLVSIKGGPILLSNSTKNRSILISAVDTPINDSFLENNLIINNLEVIVNTNERN